MASWRRDPQKIDDYDDYKPYVLRFEWLASLLIFLNMITIGIEAEVSL